jgi:putative ribosome biogenesis GTPase RsgA
MTDLPEFYFRIRENGAAVYRVSTENRQRRIEMTEIAVVNVKNGNVRPHGDHVLSEAEEAAIAAWMEARRAELSRRDLDDIHRTIDHLNLTAHWAQSRATEAELEDVTDRLLLAMHDLRTVLVRKKSDRIGREES